MSVCHERCSALSLPFEFLLQLLRKLKICTPRNFCTVAQVGFHTNLTLGMVFLWQNYFIEPEDFFLSFCLSFKSHAEIITFIVPKSLSLGKKLNVKKK